MKPRIIIIIAALLLILVGCSDDDPLDTIRYHWPTWSYDDSFVISRYEVNPQDKAEDSPVMFSILDNDDGIERFISVPKVAGESVRFWVSNRVDRMVVTGLGARVIDFDGNIVSDRIEVFKNLTPSQITFSDFSRSYYWHVRDGNRSIFGIASDYSGIDLSPQASVALLDTTMTSNVEYIAEASEGSCAVLLSDGTILIVTTNVTHKLYESSPITSPSVGAERIQYLKPIPGSNIDYLYVLDADGLKRINLTTSSADLLLSSKEGNLLSFDLEPDTRNVLFVTSGSQVWLASENATPIQALLYEHSMGKLSHDGTSIAAVGYLNGAQNNITILQFRQ